MLALTPNTSAFLALSHESALSYSPLSSTLYNTICFVKNVGREAYGSCVLLLVFVSDGVLRGLVSVGGE